MRNSLGLLIVTFILIVFVMSAGCARMPEESANIPGSGEYSTDAGTPVPTEAIVSFSTPVPTEPTESRPKFSVPPDETNPEDRYLEVYNDTTTFNYNVIPFDYNLTAPPMVFYYSATVPLVTDEKAGYSQFGSKNEYSSSYENPNPLANYMITVYDKDTNEVLYVHEIPRFSEETLKDRFKIYEAGNYHIEISGNLATVKTSIKVPPENLENK